MTLTLELPSELEEQLAEEARRLGRGVEEHALYMLKEGMSPDAKRARAILLLQSWRNCTEEEAQEQRETGDWLIKVLDEDRTSARKLFPPELEGITW